MGDLMNRTTTTTPNTVIIESDNDVKETKILVELLDDNEHKDKQEDSTLKMPTIISTKLRPEAPPFMPERIMTLMKSQGGNTIRDQLQSNERYCTNVNLEEPNDVVIDEVDIAIRSLPDPESKSFKDTGLKPFSIVSNMKRPSQRSQIMDTRGIMESETHGPITDPEISNRPGILSRFPNSLFLTKHKTKIVVCVVSVVVCIVLVAYALI